MSVFDAQHIRNEHRLSWLEDYVLGLVDRTAPITTTRINRLVLKQNVRTPFTVRTCIKDLVDRGLIEKVPDAFDKRNVNHVLTKEGKKIMKEIRDATK